MERWHGRVALVTGASSGIGAAICRALVKNGLKVVGCARTVDRIKALADEAELKKGPGTLHACKCDLTKESDILATFDFIRKQFGRIDVCVNNAGLNSDCPLMSGKTEVWKHMFEVNVLSLCICSRESIQLMKEKNIDDGQIINISSIAGHIVLDFNNCGFYTGTKFMVNALTESLRKELRDANTHIRACTISPGLVRTEFVSRMSDGDPTAEEKFYKMIKPLEAESISEAVISVLQTSPNVDINNIIIRPIEQKF